MSATQIPTAPYRLPAVGHTVRFLRDPIGFMELLQPLGPLVRVYFGSRSFYYVSDPLLVHEVLLAQNEAFEKGRLFEKMKTFAGEGVGTVAGEQHRMQRRMVRPALHPDRLEHYAEIMYEHAQRGIAGWKPGQQVRVDRVTLDYTVRVIVATLLPAQLHPHVARHVIETVPKMLRDAIRFMVLPEALFRLPLRVNKEIHSASGELAKTIDELISSYRASPIVSEQFDLLSYMLDYRVPQTGEEVPHKLMRDQVMNFLIAGHETTSSALTSVFWMLDQHPEIRERVYRDLEALGAEKVTQEALMKVPYTRAFVKEVLRLYPPGWMLPRRTTQGVQMGNIHVPAGCELLISPMALHRRPDVFRRPHVFDPDRWIDAGTQDIPKGAYIPFGLGPHVCLGAQFAEIEIVTFLAAVSRGWRLVQRPVAADRFRFGLTARLPELQCVAVPR
ncbi:cytochrome P450 [Amycolatopsis sp. NPDC001319]|uniref:cytochrome P450 n=1 Tax=unclassified Amycolatopsis TaxID=2618356 RepID=UPI003677EE59